MFSPAKALHVLLVVAIAATLHSAGAPTPTARANEAAAGPPTPVDGKHAASPANLLQFRAGGHVLGFTPGRVYLAGLDHALRVEFLGTMNTSPPLVSGGSVGDGGPASIPLLSQITYPDLWPGISLSYEAAGGGIAKSTYHLAPGADPVDIQLRYNLPFELASDGSLRFQLLSGRGWLAESPPLAWQDIGGERVPVEVAFMMTGDQQVGFRVGGYNPRYPLTIDPTYQWHTFYGSRSDEWGRAIAVDASGNVYVLGGSDAAWPYSYPARHRHSGGADLVVVKLDGGGHYLWHTFYGSSGDDYGYGIAVDGSGNVYITGSSPAPWSVDGTSARHAHSGMDDLVVVKLNSSGYYQWHTFYGSSLADCGHGIAVGGDNVYITGSSQASWLGDSGQSPLHSNSGDGDLLVLKLNSSGFYQWHTFYGSSSPDTGYGVAVDGSGEVTVAGSSEATWQADGTPPRHAHSGNGDLVVLRLNSSGFYQWHTFYGSSSPDTGYGVAVDGSGEVYVAGSSKATWQADGTPPRHAHSGDGDLAVLKLDSGGVYQWHTFYGSSSPDAGYGIAVDNSGEVYIVGSSEVTWQVDGTPPRHAHSGDSDLAVLKLNSSGVYQWHTFYGSSSSDTGYGVALDGSGDVYIVGHSSVMWEGDGGRPPLNPGPPGPKGMELVVLKLDNSGLYQWHTCHGTGSNDWGIAVAVDGNGDVYVTGRSEAAWQGDSGQSPLHSHSGDGDLVVVKLDSNGVYQWHTFYGSSTLDEGWGITIDANGDVYVTGFSYGTWQADGGAAPLHAHSGGSDLVVLKLDSSGAYQWHTFYPGQGRGITVDSSGDVYVTGISYGTWQGDGEESPLHGYNGDEDLVVLKLDSAGIYQWHTFYGSYRTDYGKAIAIDFSGDVYITGYSWVTWSGNGDVEPLHAHSGYFDLVVLKLNSAGIYQWHTFYGSSAFDEGRSITIDGSEDVYVTGASYGAWQGDNGAHPLHSFNASSLSGYSDLVVLKLDGSGVYQWHTFYGSIYSESGSRIAVDGRGDATIIGGGQATWQGDGGASPLHSHSRFPNDDLVVLKLDNSGGYRWHTFYGADSSHQVNGAIDSNGNVYATGWSEATWLEDGTPPLHAYDEGEDLVVIKLAGRRQLSMGKDGSGGGTVTSDPAGINCGYACSAEFDYGTLVTLTAVADTGSTFTGWGGACSGTGDCVVTMDTAKSVTATFAIYRVYLPLVMRIF
jgi:hypothetical protein